MPMWQIAHFFSAALEAVAAAVCGASPVQQHADPPLPLPPSPSWKIAECKEEKEELDAIDSQEQGRSPSECCWIWP